MDNMYIDSKLKLMKVKSERMTVRQVDFDLLSYIHQLHIIIWQIIRKI